jgi:polyisoprenoid-binding protein YceI
MQALHAFKPLHRRRWRFVAPLLGLILPACAVTGQPPPVATPAASPGGQLTIEPGGAVRLTLTPSFSKASYRAQEQLRALNFPNEAVGSTHEVTGSIVIEESGAIRRDESRITADLRSMRSDDPIRDNYIQQETLQTRRFPTAEFQLSELRDVPRPIPIGTDVSIELLGDLTVHGTRRPVTWVGSARLDGDTLTGAVSTHVTITEFGMRLPSVVRVLTLEDAMTLELVFQARSEVMPPL